MYRILVETSVRGDRGGIAARIPAGYSGTKLLPRHSDRVPNNRQIPDIFLVLYECLRKTVLRKKFILDPYEV